MPNGTAASRPSRPVLPEQRLLSAKQAAAELGIPYTTLRDIAQRGLLPVIKFDDSKFARWFFDRRDLDELIDRRKLRQVA